MKVATFASINNSSNGNDSYFQKLNDKKEVKPVTVVEERKNNKWCCCHIKLPITGRIKSKSLTALLIIFTIDMLSCLGLVYTTHTSWFTGNITFNFHSISNDFDSFHNGTIDITLMWVFRFLLLIILTIIAVCKGVPKELWNKPQDKNPAQCDEKLEILISNGNNKTDCKSHAQKQKSDDENPETSVEESIEGIEDNRRFHPHFDDKEELQRYKKRCKRATIYKYCILLFMFFVCTGFQAYMGVKSITFRFDDKYIIYEAMCFGACILCINIEIFLLKDIIENATDHGDNILVNTLHPHPLAYKTGKQYHCDVCRKPSDKTYRCMRCDYDVCCDCFKKEKKRLKKQSEKKSDNNAENTLNDDGEEDEKRKQLNSISYLKRSFELCAPHWYIIVSGAVFLVICCGLQLILPSIQGRVFDSIINGNKNRFIFIIKCYLILSVFSGLFNSLRDMMFHFLWQRLTAGIRQQMFSNILIQDITFFDNTSTGELMSRIGNDVWQMTDPIHNVLRSSLSNSLLLLGGMTMCFVTSWRLSMLAFTTLAPILYLTTEYSKWSRNIWSSVWGSFAKSQSIAQQAFTNIRTVRSFGTELKEIKKYNKTINEMLKSGLIVNIGGIVVSFATNYLDLGAGVLLLYFGGMALFDIQYGNEYKTELTLGKLITFQLYWNMMTAAYKGLQNVLTSFTKGLSAGERVLLILDRMSKHKHHLYNGKKCELDGEICIDNVSFTYVSRPLEPVLKGINLNIKPSQVVAIVGKSGGGKTTLIHLLMRFYDIKNGTIYYNKNKFALNDLNLTKFRQQIGFVGQDTETFDASVKDNITYGCIDENGEERDVSMDEIIHYSKLANCHEFVDKFDEKYETKVGERGIKLSGGQKQRLAIARMLIKRPKILLLDEATSNLDTESEALVQAAIDKTIWCKKGINNNEEEKYDINNENENKFEFKANAVILIAHRLSTVINADKIAVIDNGKIVELGNHQELLNIENGVYKKLVQRQIQKQKNKLNLEKDEKDIKDKNEDDCIDNLFD